MDPSSLAERLCAHQGSPGALWRELVCAGLDPVALRLRAKAPVDGRPYGRQELLSTPALEVMVARWSSGASCAPHDHGGAHGWVFYLEGRFLERRYVRGPGGWREDSVQERLPGSVGRVEPALTHACTSEGEGLSLHVYFPRVRGMKVHALASRQTYVVAEAAGAWVPDAPSEFLTVETWAP